MGQGGRPDSAGGVGAGPIVQLECGPRKAADRQDAGGWAVGGAAEGDGAGEQVGGVGGEYVCDSNI